MPDSINHAAWNIMIMRAVKRQSNYSDSEATDIKRFTRQNVSCSHSEQLCLFCEKPATRFQSLHEASTFELDHRIRLCALNLKDEKLLSKLSAGDLISIEAKYHLQCLRTFYNRDRSNIRTEDTTGTSRLPTQHLLNWFHIYNPYLMKIQWHQYFNFRNWKDSIWIESKNFKMMCQRLVYIQLDLKTRYLVISPSYRPIMKDVMCS